MRSFKTLDPAVMNAPHQWIDNLTDDTTAIKRKYDPGIRELMDWRTVRLMVRTVLLFCSSIYAATGSVGVDPIFESWNNNFVKLVWVSRLFWNQPQMRSPTSHVLPATIQVRCWVRQQASRCLQRIYDNLDYYARPAFLERVVWWAEQRRWRQSES